MPIIRLSEPLLKKSPDENEFKGDFYTADEANQLINLLRSNSLLPVVQLALFYGLRRSEVLGLRWSSVNFQYNTIRTEHTVVKTRSTVEKKRTKNKRSLRTLPLTLPSASMLQNLKKEQQRNQLLFGKDYKHSDYVCRLQNGSPMTPSYITQQFSRFLKRNKGAIKMVRFHDLRHTAASLLLAEGYNLQDIQAWLGHESIKSTEIYSHLQVMNKSLTADTLYNILKFG